MLSSIRPCLARNRASTNSLSEPDMVQANESSNEDANRHAEDELGAETVGHLETDRDEDDERNKVCRQFQLERDRACADIGGGDRRQRSTYDGRVHGFHEQGDGKDQSGGFIHSGVWHEVMASGSAILER